MAALSLLAFAILAIVDWRAVARGQKEVEYVAKPGALAVLLVYATTGASPSGWLIAALVLSLLGDVYLMLPANLFVAGLVAFLLAHLAYIADFEAAFTIRMAWWVLTLAVAAPLALKIIRSIEQASLRVGVVVYMAVIALMVASALASGSLVAVVGAVLFFASDGILAWNRFVRPLEQGHLLVMITYHLGQLGLVAALRGG